MAQPAPRMIGADVRSTARLAPAEETELVARAKAGDVNAVECLVRSCIGDAYDVALRILGDRDAAQDAVQDACVNAIRGLHAFRGDGSFRGWLLHIVANAARTLLRQSGRRREVDIDHVGNEPSPGADPAERAMAHWEAERLRQALARLPEKQRLAVTLRTYQGLSYREIAEITSCSEGAARVNYHLGVKQLKQLLQ